MSSPWGLVFQQCWEKLAFSCFRWCPQWCGFSVAIETPTRVIKRENDVFKWMDVYKSACYGEQVEYQDDHWLKWPWPCHEHRCVASACSGRSRNFIPWRELLLYSMFYWFPSPLLPWYFCSSIWTVFSLLRHRWQSSAPWGELDASLFHTTLWLGSFAGPFRWKPSLTWFDRNSKTYCAFLSSSTNVAAKLSIRVL